MLKKLTPLLLLTLLIVPLLTVKAVSPFDGVLIALDAGHGGDDSGAINETYDVTQKVMEKDVNLDVVLALKTKLEEAGATVVLTREADETIISRRDRVELAVAKCMATELARSCDLLVSVHHNGNLDPEHDGTLTIYNEKQDIPLAKALHDALLPLTENDEGYLNGGYGITVYDHLISSLTEAYYITNDEEVEKYLDGARVSEEVDAQFAGIKYYLENKTSTGAKKSK